MVIVSKRKTQLGLWPKLTLLIEGLVVILVLVTGIVTTMREKDTMERELRKRGLALASDLAALSQRPLLANDLASLRRYVNHSMDQEYVRYAMILDTDGKVIMHSDLSQVGCVYKDSLTVAAVKSGKKGCTDVHTGSNEELHCDIYAPIQIADAILGTVRLGYSHLAMEKEVTDARREVLIVGLATTVVGGFVAYFLAAFIALPIKRITDAVGRVAGGELGTPLDIRRGDEIGTLAEAFNRMTVELQKTTVSKDFFNDILTSLNDALVVVGADGAIMSANRRTGELLGYENNELQGMAFSQLVPRAPEILGAPDFLPLLGGGASGNREADYVTKTGQRIPMLLSTSVLKGRDGTIVGVVCSARDITERKEAEEALKRSERELHHLSSQLIRAQEDERRRLSIELHDELGQSLIVLQLQVSSIQQALLPDQEALRHECGEMIAYIKEVTENVRRLSRDLSPVILDDLTLSAALRYLVNGFSKYSGLDCQVELWADIDGRFSREEAITIYRIIQESLTNVAKHAEATRVAIRIEGGERLVTFQVRDNGRGFDAKQVFCRDDGHKGVGLTAMCERVRMLGGSIDISGRKGEGGCIVFSVPVRVAGGEQ